MTLVVLSPYSTKLSTEKKEGKKEEKQTLCCLHGKLGTARLCPLKTPSLFPSENLCQYCKNTAGKQGKDCLAFGNWNPSPLPSLEKSLSKIREANLRESLVAQMVKRLPTMQETWVRSLGQEDSLEDRMAIPLQYSGLENPIYREAWQATVHGVVNSQTRLSD